MLLRWAKSSAAAFCSPSRSGRRLSRLKASAVPSPAYTTTLSLRTNTTWSTADAPSTKSAARRSPSYESSCTFLGVSRARNGDPGGCGDDNSALASSSGGAVAGRGRTTTDSKPFLMAGAANCSRLTGTRLAHYEDRDR
ncbi:hypothetical protein PG996_001720 [Apiospora saccharicola]|uniref:Uncharacterized protein n=1 Tax=Apiospora saccharicola TaxID=335842 RepID=A0ABR1WLD5_9PEZI